MDYLLYILEIGYIGRQDEKEAGYIRLDVVKVR